MAKLLRELLEAKEPTFSIRLRALEAATGQKKIDLTLLSEILSDTAGRLRGMSLDPEDTTSEELYGALQGMALKNDRDLEKSCGGDLEKLLGKLNKRLPATAIPVVKASVLKKLVAANPPKKVMAALGFRSPASMMKRASMDQLLLGCFMLESVTWHRQFMKRLKNLTPSDITMELPRAVLMKPQLMKSSRFSHVISLQCAGLVGVPPLGQKQGRYLFAAATAAEGLFHLHVRGVLLKLGRFDPASTKNIAAYTYASPSSVGRIAKISVPWVSVYAMIAETPSLLADSPEAAVDEADFKWSTPGEALCQLSSRLDFWRDSQYLARRQGRTVSLNISDIALNTYNLVPLSLATHAAFSRSLHGELMKRYLMQAAQKTKIMKEVGLLT